MKKLLALLLALTLCATAAFAEEGVFDYTVFEENEDIDLEIDNFDKSWSISISTFDETFTGFSAQGTLDGKVEMAGLIFVGDNCDEVKVLLDDTMYTFNTRMQEVVLDLGGCLITLTPETESFFQALATAESVDIRLTTAGGEDIDTSITGSDLEEIQFVLTELFAQDVMNCYTADGEDLWDTADLLQTMTVD